MAPRDVKLLDCSWSTSITRLSGREAVAWERCWALRSCSTGVALRYVKCNSCESWKVNCRVSINEYHVAGSYFRLGLNTSAAPVGFPMNEELGQVSLWKHRTPVFRCHHNSNITPCSSTTYAIQFQQLTASLNRTLQKDSAPVLQFQWPFSDFRQADIFCSVAGTATTCGLFGPEYEPR